MNKLVVHDSEETTSGLPVGYEAGGSLAVSLARAEIDQQIVTARAMPRSISRAVQNIMTLATLDEASAEECIYALPRAGKAIEGPSIRLAEIIASQWGNCRVGARVVHVDRFDKFVEAEGVFHDLETNTATTSRVRRRISNKHGALLQEDMIVVTGNAACAIAKRNAILGAVPKAVWRKAYDAVKSVVLGDLKTLTARRDLAVAAFGKMGVTAEQICSTLAVGGLDDIGLEHLATLTAARSSIKNGEATIEEIFPKTDPKQPARTLDQKIDALAAGADPETGEVAVVPDKQIHESAASDPAPANDSPAGPPVDAASANTSREQPKDGEARTSPSKELPPAAKQAGGDKAGVDRTQAKGAAASGPSNAAAPSRDDLTKAASAGVFELRRWLQEHPDSEKTLGRAAVQEAFRAAEETDARIERETAS